MTCKNIVENNGMLVCEDTGEVLVTTFIVSDITHMAKNDVNQMWFSTPGKEYGSMIMSGKQKKINMYVTQSGKTYYRKVEIEKVINTVCFVEKIPKYICDEAKNTAINKIKNYKYKLAYIDRVSYVYLYITAKKYGLNLFKTLKKYCPTLYSEIYKLKKNGLLK